MDVNSALSNIKKDGELLHDSGVDIVSSGTTSGQDDTSPNVVDLSNSSLDDEKTLKESGVQFMDPNDSKKYDGDVVSSVPEINDIEKDFLKESQVVPESKVAKEIKPAKTNVLSEIEVLLNRLYEKITTKKKTVQEQIANLRKVKEEISQDIHEIKELEETQKKLKEKKDAFEKIGNEIKAVEEEANNELSSF
jgi:hypothetical protein